MMPVIFCAISIVTDDAAAEEKDKADSIVEAIEAGKPIISARLRYETVDQSGFADNADAVTFRLRAGFETAPLAETKFLVELEHVEGLNNNFNSTINGNLAFPVVPDPDSTELNRLHITNNSIPQTHIRIGRQRIIQDDSRFVGNVGWRQNEQTFDAISIENSGIKNLDLHVSYINQVNRIFGRNSANGIWNGDVLLLNAKYHKTLKDRHMLTVTGFGYLMDFDKAISASSQTYGILAEYRMPQFRLKASYAVQSDFGSQPKAYKASYYLAETGFQTNGFTIGAGYEILTGDGQVGFQTPLATLHKFNGWSDQFLKTPAAGLKDFYIKAGIKLGRLGPFRSVNAKAIYHDFRLQRQNVHLGSETDLLITGNLSDFSILLKYADFRAESLSNIPVKNTRKLWMQLEYAF